MCGLSVESAISVIVLEYEYTDNQLGFKWYKCYSVRV